MKVWVASPTRESRCCYHNSGNVYDLPEYVARTQEELVHKIYAAAISSGILKVVKEHWNPKYGSYSLEMEYVRDALLPGFRKYQLYEFVELELEGVDENGEV